MIRKAQPNEPAIGGLDASQVQALLDKIALLADHAARMQNATSVHDFAQVTEMIKEAATAPPVAKIAKKASAAFSLFGQEEPQFMQDLRKLAEGRKL